MEDTTKAEQTPEGGKQEGSMPDSQQTTNVQDSAAGAASEKKVSSEAQKDLSLPEGTKERTSEQFNKLKTYLQQERELREQAEQKLQEIVSEVRSESGDKKPSADTDVKYKSLERKLNQFVQQQQEQELKKEEAEAYSYYPELNPEGEEHDSQFHKAVRAILTDSIINPDDYDGGLTMKQAADQAASLVGKKVAEAEETGAKKALKSLSSKEQAALEASARSDGRARVENPDELKERSRKGDMDAIMARLQNI